MHTPRPTKYTRSRHGWLLTVQNLHISYAQLLQHLSSVVNFEHYCCYDFYAPENCRDLTSVFHVECVIQVD